MKWVAQVKRLPTPAQAEALRRTLEMANAACNFVSQKAWPAKTFQPYNLHHLGYKDGRAKWPLSAPGVVRVIAQVADAYKLDTKRKRTFKPLGGSA